MTFNVHHELSDLGTRPPTQRQWRWGLSILTLAITIFAALYPFAGRLVNPAVGLVALYSAGLAITNLFTALLLIGQIQIRKSIALSLLALGYFLSSLAAFAYTLFFPGLINVFTSFTDSQVNDWLYLAWHGTFSACVLAYVLTSKRPAGSALWRDAVYLLPILGLFFLALAVGWDPFVPSLLANNGLDNVFGQGMIIVLVISLTAFVALLLKRPCTLLDLWLNVVMATWLLDIAFATSFDNQSFDLGFYVGRMCGLLGSLFLFGVLLLENFSVHARLRSAFDAMIESRAREKSNELLAAVLRQLPEGVFVFDKTGEHPIINERGRRLAGDDNRIGHAKCDKPSIMAMVKAQANRAANLETFDDELIESIEAGTRRVFSVSGAAIQTSQGNPTATVIVVSDVTERIEADQVLKQSLERTRALLENTPLAAMEWGPDRVVRRWSKRAEELFGWPSSEIVGKSIDTLELIHPEDVHTVDAMMEKLISSRAAYVTNENRNITHDHQVVQCEWHNSALRSDDGTIQTVFSLALDITERNYAMAQLREADLRKDTFIATLAHELRNPLAPIANAASLLTIQRSEPEQVSYLAAMISRQSTRMGRLLDDLLDISRISQGKIELRKEIIELTTLVHETLQISMPLIESGRHHLDVVLPSNPVWVKADPVRITQIMSNLLNNSAKYTPPEGHIEVRLATCGEEVIFSVSDNGIGIDLDMLPHIFEAFTQVGSARHLSQGGLGIGLSLARGLAELHGGSLTGESEGKNRGSKFLMHLPLEKGVVHLPVALNAHGTAAKLETTILIADDNVDAAESLALLLRARGAHVKVAYDGEQALQSFSNGPTSIAILDLGMPCIDGLEVARRLSHSDQKPYLIALTGRGRKEDQAESLRAGFNEHFTKPVEIGRLIKVLHGTIRANTPEK